MSPEVYEVDPDEDNTAADTKMSVYVKIEEPDIFLVNDIEDINTDALVMNFELEFKFWSVNRAPQSKLGDKRDGSKGSIEPPTSSSSTLAHLTNIRCYTCLFNPSVREETLVQILQPCTLTFSMSQTENHGMRVDCNMSDLCLNISPHSLNVVLNSAYSFISSMSSPASEQPTDQAGENSLRRASKVNNALVKSTSVQSDLIFPEDHSKLGQTVPVEEDKFWFLSKKDGSKTVDLAVDPLMSTSTLDSSTPAAASTMDEQAIINIKNMIIKLEAGVGNITTPLLLLESSFNCNVMNWSGPRMSALGSMTLEMAYYNSGLALWEPVIEPVIFPNGRRRSVSEKLYLFI